MPLQSQLVARAQARIRNYAGSSEGARNLATYFAGQVIGQIDSVRRADQVVLSMVEEFIDTVTALSESLNG